MHVICHNEFHMRGKHLLYILVVALACGLASCKTLTYTQLPLTQQPSAKDTSWINSQMYPYSISRLPMVHRDIYEIFDNSPLDKHFDSIAVSIKDDSIRICQFTKQPFTNLRYYARKDTIYIQYDIIPRTNRDSIYSSYYSIPKIEKDYFVLRIQNKYSIPILSCQLADMSYVYPLIEEYDEKHIAGELIGCCESTQQTYWEKGSDTYNCRTYIFNPDATWQYLFNGELIYAGVFFVERLDYRIWTIHKDSIGNWDKCAWYYYDVNQDPNFKRKEYHDVWNYAARDRRPSILAWAPNFEGDEGTWLFSEYHEKNSVRINLNLGYTKQKKHFKRIRYTCKKTPTQR